MGVVLCKIPLKQYFVKKLTQRVRVTMLNMFGGNLKLRNDIGVLFVDVSNFEPLSPYIPQFTNVS